VLIDVLAWQFHVDAYDASKTLEFRKMLVQESIQWHVTKGTVALLQHVLDTYWPGGATIQEWFDYKSPLPPNYPTTGWHQRYLFRIFVNADVIAPTDEAAVLELIARYKPISRWCEEVVRGRPSYAFAYAIGYAQFYTTRQSSAAIIR
jgi:P2-related tail formation protein